MRRDKLGFAVLGGAATVAAGYLLWRRRTADTRPGRGRLESRWADVGGLRVHALVSVDPVPPGRTPVILVPGLGMSSRYMIPLATCLAHEVRVYAPDLPGFGLSDKPEHTLTVAELADALRGFMDVMRLPRAHFVGNSLGCEILVEFAARLPERVERLVLQGPTPDWDRRPLIQQVLLYALTAFFERWSLGWVALSDYLRGGVRRYVETFRDMLQHRINETLPSIQAPTLVIWGTRDHIIPFATVEELASRLPHGRLVVAPGGAHGMNYSHPRLLRDLILPFLRSDQCHDGESPRLFPSSAGSPAAMPGLRAERT